jgi:hypothetical protein
MNNDHLIDWMGNGFIGMLDRWGRPIRESLTKRGIKYFLEDLDKGLPDDINRFMVFLLDELYINQWISHPWRLALPKDGELFIQEVTIQPTDYPEYYRFLLGIDRDGKCSVGVYLRPSWGPCDWRLSKGWSSPVKQYGTLPMFEETIRPSWGWM